MKENLAATNELEEQVEYKFKDFPLAIFRDVFDSFVDNAFYCHWHDEIELAVVMRGSVTYLLNQVPYVVKEGDGLFIGPRALHSAEQNVKGTVVFNILFPSRMLSQMFHNFSFYKYASRTSHWFNTGRMLDKDVQEEWEILDSLKKIEGSTHSDNSELIQAEAILHIWQYLPKLFENIPVIPQATLSIREERMRNMITYIHDNYMYPITATTIAASANISRSECFRCFSVFGRTSPIDYLNTYRLHIATRKLLETNESISNISNSCGFSSNSYFSKIFKDNYGMSPFAFRKQNGKACENRQFQSV